MTGRGAAATPAISAAQRAGIPHSVHRYEGVGAAGEGYGLEAVAALGIDAARVHKTLVAATGDDRLVVAVVPVSGMLDLKALAEAVGARRAAMADPAAAERATGYVLGGISPLGMRRRLPTVVDEGGLTCHSRGFAPWLGTRSSSELRISTPWSTAELGPGRRTLQPPSPRPLRLTHDAPLTDGFRGRLE